MTGGRGEISSYGLTGMLMQENNIKFGNPAVTGDNLKPYILSMSGDDAADPTATLMRGPGGALLVYDRFAVQNILLVLGFDAGDGMLHDASPWHRSPVSGRGPMAPMGMSLDPGQGSSTQSNPPTLPPDDDPPGPHAGPRASLRGDDGTAGRHLPPPPPSAQRLTQPRPHPVLGVPHPQDTQPWIGSRTGLPPRSRPFFIGSGRPRFFLKHS